MAETLSQLSNQTTNLTLNSIERSHQDIVCTQCSCTCDDLHLITDPNSVQSISTDCPLARDWFLHTEIGNLPKISIDQKATALNLAIDKISSYLTQAKYPLVYGLSQSSIDSIRAAVSLADWIGAVVDTETSSNHGSAIEAVQEVGKVTCTLGEIRHRSDFLIFWGSDPLITQPRHFERYSLYADGTFIENNRAGRTCIVIDQTPTASSEIADQFIQIPAGKNYEAARVLIALSKGVSLQADIVKNSTGQPLSVWQDLFDRMAKAQFGSLFFGMGVMQAKDGYEASRAMLELTRDMNHHTRFVCKSMRGGGNATGADNVMNWRVGSPFSVSLTNGTPRYCPQDYNAEAVLSRNETDVALIIQTKPEEHLSEKAIAHLKKIPFILLESRESALSKFAKIRIQTSEFGIHEAGTAYRMDDVPIHSRAILKSDLPSAEKLLKLIESKIHK